MLSALFRYYIPARLYGGRTAYPVLSKIEQELETCRPPASVAGILEKSKTELYGCLEAHFTSPVAQALTLKILNLFLARHHFHARSTYVQSRPFGLVVDPSNMCQLACPGCVHSARAKSLKVFDWPNGTLQDDRLAALLKRYGPYVVGMYFYNYGEPLLNLNTPALISRAKTYLISTALSTSLSVQKFDADAYVESGLDYMSLSIDGVTQPVYERFRRGGELELVFSNVVKIVQAKRKLRRRTPVLSWNFLAFEHNAHEIPLATRMARKLGVNQFRIVNPFDIGWDDPDVRPAPVKARVWHFDSILRAGRGDRRGPFSENMDYAAIARAFDEPWDPPPEGGSPATSGHTCHWLYKNMVMDATGRILPCCGGPRPDTNLVFDTFTSNGHDVFNSQKYRQARAWFSERARASDGAPYCTQCEWDQTAVNIGGQQILEYFRTADPAFFDRRSLRSLSDW